jgi:hypothetical protein
VGLFSQRDGELRSVRAGEAPRIDRPRMAGWRNCNYTPQSLRPVGHLVLVIDTAEGDWVRDNLQADVVRRENLPYRWIARQQGASMEEWVSIGQRS